MVRAQARASGVTVTPMPATTFAPEIEHARVQLEQVPVTSEALLPGEAYADYIKPFRTVEDTFVTAAVAAYLLRIARACRWPEPFVARLLCLVTVLRGVALSDPSDPAIHLLLDAALGEFADLADPSAERWQSAPVAVRQRWQRDVGLMNVAARARAARRERARETLRA